MSRTASRASSVPPRIVEMIMRITTRCGIAARSIREDQQRLLIAAPFGEPAAAKILLQPHASSRSSSYALVRRPGRAAGAPWI